MDIFNWIFIFIMIVGFIIIIVSIININKYSNSSPILNIDNQIKEMKNTIDQADLAMDDLTLMSEQLFKSFDKKQKEILHLYETIENKKNIPSEHKVDIKIDEDLNSINKQEIKKNKYISSHPKATQIEELYKKNMSTDDIAKTLNIGKGEVELIINFLKG